MPRAIINESNIERLTVLDESQRPEFAKLRGKDAKGADSSVRLDGYLDRLLKMIPAEIVGAYLALSGILRSNESADPVWWWLIAVLGLALTPAYLRMRGVRAVVHLVLAGAAFVVWVYALGGPFEHFSWYEPFQGSILIVTFSLVAPLANPQEHG